MRNLTNMKAIAGGTVFVALILVLGGCQEPVDLALPTATQAKKYYTYDGALSAEVVGNVVTVSVAQDPQLIRRGGALWAKVGPYIFVFSDARRRASSERSARAGDIERRALASISQHRREGSP